MSFFSGEYECKVDTKSRMILPAKLKVRLPENEGNEIVLRKGIDACVEIVPMPEWRIIENKINKLSEFKKEEKILKRNLLRNMKLAEIDAAGRILIPKDLLVHANISKDITAIGVGNKIELWDPETLKSQDITMEQMGELAEKYLGDDEELE